MVEIGAPESAHVVGVAKLGPHALEQTAAESITQDVGHDLERRVILISQLAGQMSHGKKSLRDVRLDGQKDAGRWLRGYSWEGRNRRLLRCPIAENCFQLRFHVSRGKVHQYVRRKEVTLVEGCHIVPSDPVYGRVFDTPAIGRVFAVNNVVELASGHSVRVVIPARDACAQPSLGQLDLVLAEFGRGQHVVKNSQHFIRVFFQTGERHAAVSLLNSGFDRCRNIFELHVQLVARFRLCAAGS